MCPCLLMQVQKCLRAHTVCMCESGCVHAFPCMCVGSIACVCVHFVCVDQTWPFLRRRKQLTVLMLSWV